MYGAGANEALDVWRTETADWRIASLFVGRSARAVDQLLANDLTLITGRPTFVAVAENGDTFATDGLSCGDRSPRSLATVTILRSLEAKSPGAALDGLVHDAEGLWLARDQHGQLRLRQQLTVSARN